MLRILTPATGVLVAAALIAGCGGSNNNNGGGGSANASSSSTRARDDLKMAQCMRANGVPSFPDQGGNGPIGIQAGPNGTVTIGGVAVPRTTLRSAFQKCRGELPAPPPLSSAQIAAIRQGALKMAECMRAHGVPNFPDPQISTGPGGHGIGIRIGAGPNGPGGDGGGQAKQAPGFTQSPAFQSASKICMPLIQKAFGAKGPFQRGGGG
jgi:hypothetical protein